MTDPGWREIPGELASQQVEWIAEADDPYRYRFVGHGCRWTLTVNDFPEEVLFSLRRNDELIAEFDDRPLGWTLVRRP